MAACKFAERIKYYKVVSSPHWKGLVVVWVPTRRPEGNVIRPYGEDKLNIAVGTWKPCANNQEITLIEARARVGIAFTASDIMSFVQAADGPL